MAFKDVLLAFALAASLSSRGQAKRYCLEDSDCADLGKLECIRSFCEWGICSCPHGKAAKYLGSEKLFQCVEIKKVGEKCSNDGDDGVCGALNSWCDEEDKKCKCNQGYVPMWGGELCALPQTTTYGETCSSSLGTCELKTNNNNVGCRSASSDTYWHPQVLYDVPTCACLNSDQLNIYNYAGQNNYVTAFVHKSVPSCTARVIGDMCLYDSDCPGDATCESNRCQCPSGKVKDFTGVTCKTGWGYGQDCGPTISSTTHCDGSLGLTCGDACYINVDGGALPTPKCKCSPWHIDTGSNSCTLRVEGSECYGDYNCRGFSPTGVCVDGKCERGEGSRSLPLSVYSLLGVSIAVLALTT